MKKLLLRTLVNALAIWVATLLVPGMRVDAGSLGRQAADSTGVDGSAALGAVLAFALIGLVLAVVNALVRPLVRLLSLPVTVLTLGLFLVVINAGMLMLTAWASRILPVQLDVDSFFFAAILGSLIISLVTMIAERLFGFKDAPR